jgi:hypothetical protein
MDRWRRAVIEDGREGSRLARSATLDVVPRQGCSGEGECRPSSEGGRRGRPEMGREGSLDGGEGERDHGNWGLEMKMGMEREEEGGEREREREAL